MQAISYYTQVSCNIIAMARAANLPLIVDGSGLSIIAQRPDLVKGYTNCILTPNMAELGRIANGVGVPLTGPIRNEWQQHTASIAKAFEVS